MENNNTPICEQCGYSHGSISCPDIAEQAPAKETVSEGLITKYIKKYRLFIDGANYRDEFWISKIQQRKAELERELAKLDERSIQRLVITTRINELDLLLKIGE